MLIHANLLVNMDASIQLGIIKITYRYEPQIDLIRYDFGRLEVIRLKI